MDELRRCRLFLLVVLGIAALVTGWRAQAEAEDMDGFKSIFDGKTLDGWKASDMSYWSVEDGAITGKITGEHPLKDNLYLIWKGGELADFELKLKSRITNSTDTNSGFQFRSKELPNHDVAGYQVDNQQGSPFLVRLYDEHGRHDLSLRGQRTTFDENGNAAKETINEAAGAADFKLEEWHEYHLTCVGTRLTLKVNGKLMAEVIDNDPKNLDLQGILGLQLHSGGPTTVQFKDIRMKRLSKSDTPSVPVQPSQAGQVAPCMFYKARTSGNMWDTWLYQHEGMYYLYYLCHGPKQWDAFAMARSPDGVSWQEIGYILKKRDDAVWMGTGSTWRSPSFPQDKRFFLNFSEWRGNQQSIFLAESTDLVHWNRLGDELEFKPDPRWYNVNQGDASRWDCIWTIPRPDGGLYGYWTATPKPETGGRFGFGQSTDGVKWEALEPPKVEGADAGEVGAIEKIGSKYCLMFGDGGKMITLTADQPTGPFRAATKNRVLLSGNTYFSRFLRTDEALLVNHHTIAHNGEVFFAPLKLAAVDEGGTLRLKWWKNNDKLKQHEVAVRVPQSLALSRPQLLGNPLDSKGGLVVEGVVSMPSPGGKPVGLYLPCAEDAGVAILIASGGLTRFGEMKPDGSDFKAGNEVDRGLAFGSATRFRLLLKDSLLEFYLDDHLIQCWRLPGDSTGKLGLICPTTESIRELKVWHCTPSSTPARGPNQQEAAVRLIDKTLVVWAAPANLTQRGGGALTIDDNQSHFDGIVFGELAPAKWMAGSDFFRRTQREQANSPAETADSKTFVQVAIVYKGQQVTLYRNGQLYAQYTMASPPQEFGPQSVVVVGKRHLEQGDDARFAGAIDDARIYDQALSAEQIAALKPNEASDPKPWAWWSFDDKEAKDRAGRFIATQLVDGAKVEDGKLVLDGNTGTMLCKTGKEAPFEFETPAMPANPPASWLTYHLAHPGPGGAFPGDPNCAFYWKGQYHLHYIYSNRHGCSFAHVSSKDMVHWKWHPTTLTPPKTGHGMFSGTGFFTKEGKPAIIYHGQGSGRNQLAFASDDELEKWDVVYPITPKIRPDQDGSKISHWDPDAWVDGDTYYAIFGGNPPTLMKSPDLKNWEYVGLFLSKDIPDVQKDEDISCPNFFKIGNRHMLLCISHNKGCRYYLGEWKDEKFTPQMHARMNWNGWEFFAPESVLTPDGRRVMWAWCLLKDLPLQSGIQSLPRELSLPEDGVLRIKPLRELETLRYDEKSEANITVKSDGMYALKEIAGDTIELKVTIQPGAARQFGVQVHCDKDGNGGFPVAVEPENRTLALGAMKVPFNLKAGENLELRVFLDKNMIEVFANDRQAAVAPHRYAPGNLGVSLFSRGGDVVVKEVKGWKMKSIYTGQ